MSSSYEYKPKGVDIRVNKGKPSLRADEIACDWAGCTNMGGCKAPKGPDRLREYYNFCQIHAREYNKNWNFFSDMSDEDIHTWQTGARHGHRPTWDVRKNTSEHASVRRKTRPRRTEPFTDPFGLFDKDDIQINEQPRKRLSKLQIKALNDLGLDENASRADVRKRYARLVKQLHPDANKGDRSTEESLQRVVKAYKLLKSTSMG